MGFGNPYGDPYDESVVGQFVDILNTLGVGIVSLADTIGVSKADQIRYLFTSLSGKFPSMELGVHLHSNPNSALEKIEAAYASGCKRFDGAIKGFGGCPMAEDELVGNLATETIIAFLNSKNDSPGLDMDEFTKAVVMADGVFPKNA
jgi:hydroxymethylglutaryl-CoA lyase